MAESLSFSTPPRVGLIRRISLRYGGSKSKEVERFLKFAVVGTIGAIIDLGLTNLLLHFVLHPQHGDDRPVQIATAIGFVTAVISNFLFNRHWTYPDSRTRPVAAQLVQFFIVNSVGLGIRELVVTLLNTPFASLLKKVASTWLSPDMQVRLGANLAIMVALGIVMMWNFFVNRYWTYNDVG